MSFCHHLLQQLAFSNLRHLGGIRIPPELWLMTEGNRLPPPQTNLPPLVLPFLCRCPPFTPNSTSTKLKSSTVIEFMIKNIKIKCSAVALQHLLHVLNFGKCYVVGFSIPIVIFFWQLEWLICEHITPCPFPKSPHLIFCQYIPWYALWDESIEILLTFFLYKRVLSVHCLGKPPGVLNALSCKFGMILCCDQSFAAKAMADKFKLWHLMFEVCAVLRQGSEWIFWN